MRGRDRGSHLDVVCDTRWRSVAGETLVIVTADHGHAGRIPTRCWTSSATGGCGLCCAIPGGRPPWYSCTPAPETGADDIDRKWPGQVTCWIVMSSSTPGLFGRGGPDGRAPAHRRSGLLLDREISASIVKVEGQIIRHRGSHGGMQRTRCAYRSSRGEPEHAHLAFRGWQRRRTSKRSRAAWSPRPRSATTTRRCRR